VPGHGRDGKTGGQEEAFDLIQFPDDKNGRF
jgi:hypothetical protein